MKYLLIFTALMISTSAPALARRGCCSHHGGVAQCGSDGYEWCNDGSRSPSCTCADYDRPDERAVRKDPTKDLFSQNRLVNSQLEPVIAALHRIPRSAAKEI